MDEMLKNIYMEKEIVFYGENTEDLFKTGDDSLTQILLKHFGLEHEFGDVSIAGYIPENGRDRAKLRVKFKRKYTDNQGNIKTEDWTK